MNSKTFFQRGRKLSMGRIALMLALVVSALVSTASAQRRATPTLTSEDLLDRSSNYGQPLSVGRESSSSAISSASDSAGAPVNGLYRDPSGSFSLNFPSRNWRLITKSLDKGRLNDLRVFRKVEGDGVTSATASVYVLSPTVGLSVQNAEGLDAAGRSMLGQTFAGRFLSSTSDVIMASVGKSEEGAELQVLADQTVAGRTSVRAIIYAFEHQGKLFVVVCRAPVESFDAQAREFFTIAQSLSSSVRRSSIKAAL